MSSSGSIINNIKPHDVTAWTYDIAMQMLQEENLKLKKTRTEANVKQIEENEKEIAEKRNSLEKHCRQFGMTYGKYGTEESEVKLEATNDEQTGAVTNDVGKNAPAPSADIKMDVDSTVAPANSPTNTAANAVHDEIKAPQPAAVDTHSVASGNATSNGIDVSQETSMAAHHTIDHGASSHDASTTTDNDDPFVTSAGQGAPITNFFPLSPSSRAHHSSSFGGLNGDYTPAYANNDPFLDHNVNYTTVGHTDSTTQATAENSLDAFLDSNDSEMAGYNTSAGHTDGGAADMSFGGDEEMVISGVSVTEFTEPTIPGMEKYDNL